MKLNDRVKQRLSQLAETVGRDTPDSEAVGFWVSARHILEKFFPYNYVSALDDARDRYDPYQGKQIVEQAVADLGSGLLDSQRDLIHAELMGDMLGQANELLDKGFWQAAAVIAGAVLEDSLRTLAKRHGVSLTNAKGKKLTIDPLSQELVKAGAYTSKQAKKVLWMAGIRNAAAHGEKVTESEAADLVESVERFIDDELPGS